MTKSTAGIEVWYGVVVDTEKSEADTLTNLFRTKAEAFQALQQHRRQWPRAYVQRVTFARCQEGPSGHLKAV